MASLPESALVVLAPEAEPWVKPFRDRHDPSAAQGMPAHITILYPFKPPSAIDQAVVAGLRDLFAGLPSFHYTLAELRRFPEVVYLAPSPDHPFRVLTQVVFAHSPDTPPYSGAFVELVPHLTLAQLPDRERLDQIAADFIRICERRLPTRAIVTEVALMDNTHGGWQVRHTFRLGPD